MSAISSIGGSGLAQWLQSIRKQLTTKAGSGTSAASGTGTAGATAGTQGVQGGHRHHNGSDFFGKIQQTVVTALQAAKTSGSTEDPNQVVEDSIASLLKNMGVGANSAAGLADGNTNTNETGSAVSTASTQQAFQTLLQSEGISPQQFQADFLAAIKDAQNGSTNLAKAFSSFPMGTILDVSG